MIDCKKIIASAEAKLEGTDMFVVDCIASLNNEIELVVDSDTHVSIDTCATLSRAIEAEFDRDVEDFSLTVGSLGIGSEFKFTRQYRKNIGRSVDILLKSGVRVLAKLEEVDEEKITVSYTQKLLVEMPSGKKKKQDVEIRESYSFDDIKCTKEYIDFK
ncbi:MAG: ribosome assembly cofactor RimP [Rikenellaceae bacterium]